jgi:hypothetical protein
MGVQSQRSYGQKYGDMLVLLTAADAAAADAGKGKFDSSSC